jgi:hypothetical protein
MLKVALNTINHQINQFSFPTKIMIKDEIFARTHTYIHMAIQGATSLNCAGLLPQEVPLVVCVATASDILLLDLELFWGVVFLLVTR